MPHETDHILKAICQQADCQPDEHIEALAALWAAVVESIVDGFWEEVQEDKDAPHIHLREDMVLHFAKTLLLLEKQVVGRRLGQRHPSEIDLDEERAALSSKAHQAMVSTTASNLAKAWRQRMQERWLPKTERLLAEEKTPKQTKLSVVPREKNHFISKSFLKRFWAEDGQIAVYKKGDSALKDRCLKPFSQWGFRRNLYSDATEAWFGLIEGDATQPLEMLISTRPLNGPQREALLGYLIAQYLRTPSFKEWILSPITPLIEKEVGSDKAKDPSYRNRVFERLFKNNDFYHQIANPLMVGKWVLVQSASPSFVLPDTAACTGEVDGKRALIAPLTPTITFVATGIPEEERRIVPHRITDDASICSLIVQLLVGATEESCVGHPSHDVRTETGDQTAIDFSEVVRVIRAAVPEDD